MASVSRDVDPGAHLRALLAGWRPFELLWLIVFGSVAVGVYALTAESLLAPEALLELVASITGMITVVLVAKGRISNYYFGLVNTALYAWLAYQSAFYGEVMLNVGYYVPIQLLGLYLWSANPLEGRVDAVRVRSLTWRQRALVLAGAAAAVGGYALVLARLEGSLPLADATSTVLSVVAQALLVLRAAEQWAFWIAVNVVSIYMWTSTYLAEGVGLAMVVMWSAYLVNSIYGAYNWRRMESVGQTSGGERLAGA